MTTARGGKSQSALLLSSARRGVGGMSWSVYQTAGKLLTVAEAKLTDGGKERETRHLCKAWKSWRKKFNAGQSRLIINSGDCRFGPIQICTIRGSACTTSQSAYINDLLSNGKTFDELRATKNWRIWSLTGFSNKPVPEVLLSGSQRNEAFYFFFSLISGE